MSALAATEKFSSENIDFAANVESTATILFASSFQSKNNPLVLKQICAPPLPELCSGKDTH